MKNRRKTIQSRLVLLLVMVLVPVIGIQAYMYYGAFQERKAAELRSNLEIARATAKSFDTFVKNVLRLELAIGFSLTSSPGSNRESESRILLRTREDNPELWEIFWVSPKGVVLSATGTQFLGMNFADREYFKEIVAGREYVISDLLLSRTTGKPSFTISRAIRDEKGLLIGVVTIGILPERLDKTLGVERFKGGGLAVVDSKGMLVFRYPVIETTWEERNWLKQYPQFGDALKGKEVSATVYAPFEGKNRMVSFAPIPSIGWAASAGQREEEVTRPILAAIGRNAVIAGLILAMAFFIALSVARRIANPIMMLRQYALALGREQGRQPLPAQSVSELNDLADAFNTMAENVRARETALQESEQRWATTLASIGDAVIATDVEGKIAFMNAVAEQMTGWTLEEAAMKPVAEIFNIINEQTRGEVENPVAKVLRDGMIVGLANHTVLVRKDGTEVPIDDSGAPIRGADGKTMGVVLVFRDITERKRMEEELRQTEERFRLALKNAPVSVAVQDRNFVYQWAYNQQTRRPDEIVGKTDADLFAPEDVTWIRELKRRVLESGNEVHTENWVTSNGRRVFLDLYYSPMRDPAGEITGIGITVVNLTEQKRAEEALRESERRERQRAEELAALFEAVPMPVFIAHDPDCIHLTGNRLADEILRISHGNELSMSGPEETRPRHFRALKDGRELGLDELPAQRACQGEHVKDFEFTLAFDDGMVRHVLGYGAPLLDDQGHPRGTVAVLLDITERKRMEDELRRSRDELELRVQERTQALRRQADLLELAHNAIIVRDMENRITFWNHGAEEMYGWTRDEAKDTSIHYLLKTKFPASRDETMMTLMREGEWEGELEQTTRDGRKITVLSRRALQWDEAGNPAAIMEINLDITAARQAEEQLRQSQKMQAVGTLAGGIAHDFNNMLAAIIGNAELAMDDVPEEMAARHNLDQIFKAGMRARGLVRQILTFSRKTEHERKPIPLTPLVNETFKLLRSSLPTTIGMQLNIDTVADMVLADPVQIQQVLMNLSTNAGDAMRHTGGRLEVSLTDTVFTEGGPLPEAGMQPGTYVTLTVSDTGPGMDENIQSRIFEPFFTTKERGQGTGMGLAVVYGIVQSHQGAITVASQPGQGATFTVYLPRHTSSDKTDEPTSHSVPKGKERILFVDDEELLVEMAEGMLERLGYKFVGTTDSTEALQTFTKDPHAFDLVLTDHTMPNMTGAVLAQKLKEIRPDIPVILCTGYSETISKEKAESMGIDGFVMKPLSRNELGEAVRRVLDTKVQA